MRSPFRYPGGKSRSSITDWILGHSPPGMLEYREPFVGGGGVYFSLQPSAVKRRWINDRHEGLVAVYQALRDRPQQFIELCRSIEPARPGEELTSPGPRGTARYPVRLKAVFDAIRLDETCDQALRYFFVNRTVFGGRVNYHLPSRLCFTNPQGWNIVASDHLECAAQHIRGTKITCGDYARVFAAPGDGVWIYVDPPYVANTRMTPTSQLYQYGFTMADHSRTSGTPPSAKARRRGRSISRKPRTTTPARKANRRKR
jgi:DNA adenine methylase